MENNETGWRLELARTLWFNIYRAQVIDAAGEYIASLRLIPAIPIDREELPADAPEVEPYVLVVVEDAVISEHELVAFEKKLADEIVARMAQHDFRPAFCQFAYPSPPQGGPIIAEFGS
jgi:hypothetical protein